MSIFKLKRFTEIYSDMKNWVIGSGSGLTNFSNVSRVKAELTAVAIKLEELYFKVFLGLQQAIPISVYEGFDFTKRTTVSSLGSVVLSASSPVPIDVTIPIGSVYATAAGIQVRTTAVGAILTGNVTSGDIAAEAVIPGSAGNILAHTVSVIVTPITYVTGVDNSIDFTGGTDAETDDQRKQRFKDYILGLARVTKYGLRAGALSIPGVVGTSVSENNPSAGYIKVYIDDGTGAASASLITQVQKELDGTNLTTQLGWRGVGTVVTVLAPTAIPIPVTLALTIDSLADILIVRADVKASVKNYINSLQLDEDVIFTKLSQAVTSVPFVLDVVFSTPTVNVTIAAGEVARTDMLSGLITIT